jgi:hypothetical protein
MAKPALFGKLIEVFYLIPDSPQGFASAEWQKFTRWKSRSIPVQPFGPTVLK